MHLNHYKQIAVPILGMELQMDVKKWGKQIHLHKNQIPVHQWPGFSYPWVAYYFDSFLWTFYEGSFLKIKCRDLPTMINKNESMYVLNTNPHRLTVFTKFAQIFTTAQGPLVAQMPKTDYWLPERGGYSDSFNINYSCVCAGVFICFCFHKS